MPRFSQMPLSAERDLLKLADQADFVMQEFLQRGYDVDAALTLTDITLNLYGGHHW